MRPTIKYLKIAISSTLSPFLVADRGRVITYSCPVRGPNSDVSENALWLQKILRLRALQI